MSKSIVYTRTLLRILAATLLASSANALTAPKPPEGRVSYGSKSSPLYQSSIPQDFLGDNSSIHLPNQSKKEQEQRQEFLDKMEIGIGRVAIVGAVGLMLKEVATGESIFQQVLDLFSH